MKVSKIGETKSINSSESKILASGLFGITYSILLYKIKHGDDLDISSLYKEYERIIFTNYNLN